MYQRSSQCTIAGRISTNGSCEDAILSATAALGLQGSKLHVYRNPNEDILPSGPEDIVHGVVKMVNRRRAFILDKITYPDCSKEVQARLENDFNMLMEPTGYLMKPKERPSMNQRGKEERKSLRLRFACSTEKKTKKCSFHFTLLWCPESEYWYVPLTRHDQPSGNFFHNCDEQAIGNLLVPGKYCDGIEFDWHRVPPRESVNSKMVKPAPTPIIEVRLKS